MSLMRNPRFSTSLLNWVSKVSVFKPLVSLNPRSFATQRTLDAKSRDEIRKLTQVAMFDYFHHNRGLDFLVAESMSKNAPAFNENLLKKLHVVIDNDDLVRSITRFLWFHPVNEFEPFLESLGLKPSEFSPCDKMFLSEDEFLLENYYVLWNYGVGRDKQMGKIFKEAREVFGYESGVLASKTQAYEDLGFSKSFLLKIIVCSPRILIGNVNVELMRVIEMLGFGFDWIEEHLKEEESYDWSSMYRCLSFLRDLCVDEDELCELIKKRPGLIFENSGEWTLILAGFGTKLGSSRSELSLLYQKCPESLGKCVSNLRRCFLFLRDIKMECDEIGKVFRSHSWWLGVSLLKRTRTLFVNMKSGRRRLCLVVRENPQVMKKWTVGSRVQPLPVDTTWRTVKTQFLLYLGYKDNSKEMEMAFKSFRGKGCELQERFDFLVSLGLNEKDVKDMVRASPGILSQSSDVLKTKINYLVNELGYPVMSLVASPSCLRYTLERIKLRFAMFLWLRDRGKADPKLLVSTLLVYSDKKFMTRLVNLHPDGPRHFEDLKKELMCK